MFYDRAQIEIRVRDHLELLDLAIAVCRRHVVGLGICAFAGIAPSIALDLVVASAGTGAAYALVCLLVLQVPWATSLITLYLGQAAFEPQVSAKRIIKGWCSAFPTMFLFQGVLRFVCAFFWPLWIYIGLRMKYSNEIILLEQAGVRETSKRNSKFHSTITSRLVREAIVDGLIFISLLVACSIGLSQFTNLLGDRRRPTFVESVDQDNLSDYLFDPLMSWQGLTVFWGLIAFFSAARFLCYLDARIRREGWDVEIKLRAQGARLAEGWKAA